MNASFFDQHVAELCPAEYAAMRAAGTNYRDLASRFLEGDAAVTEADCLAARDMADRAEAAARAAFRLRGGEIASRTEAI